MYVYLNSLNVMRCMYDALTILSRKCEIAYGTWMFSYWTGYLVRLCAAGCRSKRYLSTRGNQATLLIYISSASIVQRHCLGTLKPLFLFVGYVQRTLTTTRHICYSPKVPGKYIGCLSNWRMTFDYITKRKYLKLLRWRYKAVQNV